MTADAPAGYVLIADDHPLFRDALRQVVQATLPDHAISEAHTFDGALAAAEGDQLDLILLDINMPGMNGFAGLISLRNHVPATPVVVVSADEARDTISQAMTLGASGFIPKSLEREQMIAAVRMVMNGEVFVPAQGSEPLPSSSAEARFREGYEALTAQQRKVLEMLVAGKSNKVIAYELDITESTVKAHVTAILRKLRVHSRTQAVLNASRMLPALRGMSA
ncbi:MAG TPA: response regulator transcription factor [Magnetospirillum sp.]|jgi:DNA-binding NarL/FixJ family response regulator|nr:response regulator transcription factor [Magnetospirillum sp.]